MFQLNHQTFIHAPTYSLSLPWLALQMQSLHTKEKKYKLINSPRKKNRHARKYETGKGFP